MFTITNIGRSCGLYPLKQHDWEDFQDAVTDALNAHGLVVGYGTGTSVWEHQEEEFASFHALVAQAQHDAVRRDLARIGRSFGQETVAFVVSQESSLIDTELFETAEQPPPPFEVVDELTFVDGRLVRFPPKA